MKAFRRITLLLLTALLLVTLCACAEKKDEGEGEEGPLPEGTLSYEERMERTVNYYVDWCDGTTAIKISVMPDSRGVYDYSSEQAANRGRSYYEYHGLYTAPNGGGMKAFDTSGVCLLSKIENGTTFYASWSSIDVVISYNLASAAKTTFLDGSTQKTVRVTFEGELPAVFPDVVCEVGEFLYWRSPSMSQISDGNILRDEAKKVSAHISGGGFSTSNGIIQSVPQSSLIYGDDSTYLLTLTPVISYETRFLTLDYGTGQITTHELAYGAEISGKLSVGDTFGGKELVGWATSPIETQNFVVAGQLTEDMKLYAIWKNFRTVRFHTLDGEIVEKNVYQYETHYLPAPEDRANYVFFGWYSSADYETLASRIITYDGTVSDYYAKWQKEKQTFFLNWPTGSPSKYTVSVQPDGTYPMPDIKPPNYYNVYFLGIYTEKNGGGAQVYDPAGHAKLDSVIDGANYYAWCLNDRVSFKVGNYKCSAELMENNGVYNYVSNIGDLVANFKYPVSAELNYKYGDLTGFYTTDGVRVFDAEGHQVIESIEEDMILYPRYDPSTVTFVFELPEGCTFDGGNTEYTKIYTYLDEVLLLPDVIVEDGTFRYWINVSKSGNTTGTQISNGRVPTVSGDKVSDYKIVSDQDGNYFVYLYAAVEQNVAGGNVGGAA